MEILVFYERLVGYHIDHRSKLTEMGDTHQNFSDADWNVLGLSAYGFVVVDEFHSIDGRQLIDLLFKHKKTEFFHNQIK